MMTYRRRSPVSTMRGMLGAALFAAAALVAGCGGGGGGSGSPAASSASPAPLSTNPATASFTLTGDSYGMENATFLSATKSGNGLTLRAAVAASMTDPDFKTVARIDIPDPAAISAGKAYSLGTASSGSPFPGTLYFFNGHQSTLLQTTGGTITFSSYGTNAGEVISGSFTARILDGGDNAVPKGSYTIAATFTFVAEASGQILPLPTAVPASAASLYSSNCASCHSLGLLDAAAGTGCDLALKGGKLGAMFPAGAAGHKGITLTDAELSALKVLLNVN